MFPNGLWAINGNSYVPAPSFNSAVLFSSGGVPVQAHENFGAIGALNYACFIDPTPNADIMLSNRRLVADVDVMAGHLANMNTSGILDYGIYSTGYYA